MRIRYLVYSENNSLELTSENGPWDVWFGSSLKPSPKVCPCSPPSADPEKRATPDPRYRFSGPNGAISKVGRKFKENNTWLGSEVFGAHAMLGPGVSLVHPGDGPMSAAEAQAKTKPPVKRAMKRQSRHGS